MKTYEEDASTSCLTFVIIVGNRDVHKHRYLGSSRRTADVLLARQRISNDVHAG